MAFFPIDDFSMEVPDYYETAKDPLDLELIKDRVSSENYYTSLEMFCADFRLMFHNCRLYNSHTVMGAPTDLKLSSS